MEMFDTWEGELYHWGIPKMKWGQNRYQNPDGTWTAEGLARRRERERKAEAKKSRGFKRANRLKDMTDEELRRGIARANLEKEYKEATKSDFGKTVSSLANAYSDYKTKQFERRQQRERDRLEEMKYKTQQVQALYNYRTAVQQKRKAKAEKAGDKAKLIQTKADKTISGAIRARLAKFVGSTPMSVAQIKAKRQREKLDLLGLNKRVSDLAADIYTDPTTYEAFRKQVEKDFYTPKDYTYDENGKKEYTYKKV